MPVPGPRPLGRGVVVSAGEAVPAPWRDAEVVTVDDAVLADPADAVDRLHRAWWERRPVVVALAVDPASFRRPQSIEDEPWRLGPAAEPWFDRLHSLVWANTYDARDGEPVWWWGVKARPGRGRRRGHARRAGRPAPGRRHARCGSTAAPVARATGPSSTASTSSTTSRSTSAAWPWSRPWSRRGADLAPDQLAAVAHDVGPARVIAPAGSGKTRVLTERLRHLHRDRRYERRHDGSRSPTTSRPSWSWRPARATSGRGCARSTRSGCGCSAEHRGSSPPVLDERDVRRIVESLVPGKRPAPLQHRPDRALRRGARAGPPRPARPRAGRGRARRRPRAGRDVPPLPRPPGRPRRRRLRRADLRRRRGAAARRARSASRSSARAATCSSTSSRTSPRPTCCCCGCSPSRRSTCSASATTTRRSTATPAPTRRSSSTTTASSRAPSPTR